MNEDGPSHDLPAPTHLAEWKVEDFEDPTAGKAFVELAGAFRSLQGVVHNAAEASIGFAEEGREQRKRVGEVLDRVLARLEDADRREAEAKRAGRASSPELGTIAHDRRDALGALQKSVEAAMAQAKGESLGAVAAYQHLAEMIGGPPDPEHKDPEKRAGWGLVALVGDLRVTVETVKVATEANTKAIGQGADSMRPEAKKRAGWGILGRLDELSKTRHRAAAYVAGAGAGGGVIVLLYELIHKLTGH